MDLSKYLLMDIPVIKFGSSDPGVADELDSEIPDIEAAIDELSRLGKTPVFRKDKPSYTVGDRLWVLDQNFKIPLLATVTSVSTNEAFFKYDGRPSETYTTRDHSIQIIVKQADKVYPSNFKNALKTLWGKIIIRKVKFVNRPGKGFIKYYDGRTDDKVEYSSKDEVCKLLSDTGSLQQIVRHESQYYGFTTKEVLYPNDKYGDIEFFFGNDNNGQITQDVDWSLFDVPMGLSPLKERKPPPLNDKLICGIPEKSKIGNQLSRWISCSRQFVFFWEYIMGYSDRSPKTLITEVTKPNPEHPKYNMLRDIFEHLDTNIAARLCIETSLVREVSTELRKAKEILDEAGIVQWVTTDNKELGIQISDAAKMYMKAMTTVYGIPKKYQLFPDQPLED